MSEPAFPYTIKQYEDGTEGMSLRDYFAAAAPPVPKWIMDAYIDNYKLNNLDECLPPWNDRVLRDIAYQEARWRLAYADAMMKARGQ